MSLLEELSNKGACVAWSPLSSHRQLLALGTKDSGRVGFDDVGGVLEIHGIGSTPNKKSTKQPGGVNEGSTIIGSFKISSRLAALDWSGLAVKGKEYPYGAIAGGMGDGSVVIWDPAVLLAADRPKSGTGGRLASIQRHSGAVSGLGFNPHKSSNHLLASGGVDSKVFVIALDRPDTPNIFVPAPPPCSTAHEAEISTCAWNTQVPHILGTAGGDGLVVVWDLRKKKPWCELRDAARSPVSDLAWNPAQGLHVMTASGDDRNPVLKLWDLRSSTNLPLATLHGHTEGVLSIGWCPQDPSLLVSCAKDNRTLMWDLYTMEPIYEFPPEPMPSKLTRRRSGSSDMVSSSASKHDQMFGGLGNGSGRRYQVLWNPNATGLLATCSFDRKVQIFSMVGAGMSNGRAPKWLIRPCGVSFGFGGKLVSFGKPNESQPIIVQISRVQQDHALVAASHTFESALKDKDLNGFCMQKELQAKTIHDRHVWRFMQVIFEQNSREKLLTYLGFNADAIAKEADKPIAKQDNEESKAEENVPGNSERAEVADGIQHGKIVTSATAPQNRDQSKEEKEKLAGKLIKHALLVGKFSAAVKSCLQVDNMADALLLASCGGAELWASTQAEYFERCGGSSGYLGIISAIVNSELRQFVATSNLSTWKETLAVLSTYAKSDEFASLCEILGERLENEGNDRQSANLCYMCSVNIPKTVNIWAEDLRISGSGSAKGMGLSSGRIDSLALQEFVEKVIVLSQAEPGAINDSKVAELLFLYASLLAAEGEMQVASRYIVGQMDEACAILRDRLFHASQEQGTPPPFPFASETVSVGTTAFTDGYWGSTQSSSRNWDWDGGRQSNSSSALAANTAVGGQELSLPLGWTQIYDPTRQAYYYYNTTTNVSQWEPPSTLRHSSDAGGTARQLAPTAGECKPAGGGAGAAAQVNSPSYAMTRTPSQYAIPASVPAPSFSQSIPADPIPASGVTNTATAASSGVAVPAPAPSPPARVLTPAEAIDACLALGGETAVVVQAVQSLTAMLEGMQLSPSQRKMLGEVRKASHILFCKAVAGDVESDVMAKVSRFFYLLSVRDMHAAAAVHQELSNTCWNAHKDWLKGLKHSSLLVAKAFQ